ncbi:DUF2066 domain-containing protein [Thiohalophilus thiocyanatoxydans]|uniref:DUF2066 domain-containing protein n=1 Tax=Thiohalophilus thiocyanatoxydans TaxID=381308 RepID=A0A4R8IN45_9GAMM|nr:DUF2066 domain-containing protein [Thiohalophilus thiocyanatoxydans]TDY01604.1 hypothetical protein EDC23_1493 [Thiohalophilus thiocyanatoxydans]
MTYYKQLGIMVAGLLWLVVMPLQAEQVQGLYEAEVPVESQSRKVRDVALRVALQQVLVRVTGRRRVLTVTDIEPLLEQAPRHVQQFRYQSREVEGEDEPTDVLWVRFDKQAIDRLLHENRLPVWGRTRPATLIWLVVDDRGDREILSNDMNNRVRRALEQQARLRGVPLHLPLMDLTDRKAISVSDVWGNFEENLLQASERYDAEAVLAGRVARTASGDWRGRWTLYQDGRRQTWNASGQAAEEVTTPAIDQLADLLAEQYARVGQRDQSEALRVRITGVRDLGGFSRVMDYLSDLALVEDVRIDQIEADSVSLILTSRHGRMAINQAVSLGRMLEAETVPMTPSNLENPLAEPVKGEDSGMPVSTRRVDLQYRLLP